MTTFFLWEVSEWINLLIYIYIYALYIYVCVLFMHVLSLAIDSGTWSDLIKPRIIRLNYNPNIYLLLPDQKPANNFINEDLQ